MTKNLNKITKKLSKKKGKLDSLHEKSRDAVRLRRAGGREEKLARAAATTMKGRQIYVDRVAFFRDHTKDLEAPLTSEGAVSLLRQYLDRLKPELQEEQEARRKGRPPSKRQEVLTEKIEAEEKEYQTGFWMPDLECEDSLRRLRNWNEDWSAMSNLKFVRLNKAGDKRPSLFPPKGLS
ncbi:TPA_exp: Uncharacterized protein A8136_4024 [Trichophyton benhamiae CBS 112371]|uniref:Translation machinery-associated protein 16 n=1 Tax=Arthroderma benhamiae (strain ATCC MYA-4681 / CBS 112371) TaxID=663331 RepID=D4B258_ARTBC|nr:uncharacterized protein ARB_02541 [Trichophyton benhamiae CBS 112371]EFE30619.1 conserved hypothetical protein [Trichophyton benhamiae CBS 112371]DAA73821.1 TPA_exp: Uncharacterized protein A8136_4024 [Trichophyton benhamiae CBS 112371]